MKDRNIKLKRRRGRKRRKINKLGGYSDLMDSSDSLEKLFTSKFIDSVNNIIPDSLYNSINTANMSKHSQFKDHEINSSILSQNSDIQTQSNWLKMQEI